MPEHTDGKFIQPGNTPSNYSLPGGGVSVDTHNEGIDDELGVLAALIAALPLQPLHNFAGVIPPTSGDDNTAGYSVGSRWVDTILDTHWVCLDAGTAAAVWKETTFGDANLLLVNFNNTTDWSGATPSVATFAHTFGTKDLVVVVTNGSGREVDAQVIRTTTNVSIEVALPIEQFAGRLLVMNPQAAGLTIPPAQILAALLTVDGSGSGLDADKLDGLNSTAFALAGHTHVIANVTGLQTSLDLKAPLISPALTGTPTGPTQSTPNNTTRLATTAFVHNALAAAGITPWSVGVTQVVHISQGGSNTAGDGSPYMPYATLTHAISTSKSPTGTTCYLVAGTLTEPATAVISNHQNFVVVGYGKSHSRITCTAAAKTLQWKPGGTGTKFNIGFVNITLENEADDSDSVALEFGTTSNLTLENIVFHNVLLKSRGSPNGIWRFELGNSATVLGSHSIDGIEFEYGEPPTAVGAGRVQLLTICRQQNQAVTFKNIHLRNMDYSTTEVGNCSCISTVVAAGPMGKVEIQGITGRGSMIGSGTRTIISGDTAADAEDLLYVYDADLECDFSTGTGGKGMSGGRPFRSRIKAITDHSASDDVVAFFEPVGGDQFYGHLHFATSVTADISTGGACIAGVKLAGNVHVGRLTGEFSYDVGVATVAVTVGSPVGGVVGKAVSGVGSTIISPHVTAITTRVDGTDVADLDALYLFGSSSTNLFFFAELTCTVNSHKNGDIADVTCSGIGFDSTGATTMSLVTSAAQIQNNTFGGLAPLTNAITRRAGSVALGIRRPTGTVHYNGFSAAHPGGEVTVSTTSTGAI